MAALSWLWACGDANPGNSPPPTRISFPQGVLLDPRTPSDSPAKYLFVSTGNNDRAYNSGWIIAFDMDAFFASWATDAAQGDFEVYPYCDIPGGGRCVRDAHSAVDREHPCRRLPSQPRIVECEESYFVAGEGHRIGNFATVMAGSRTGLPRVWVPVRGEPSITFAEVLPADQPWLPPVLECGTESGERCDYAHRLTHFLGDREGDNLERDPFTIVVDEDGPGHFVYVAHTEVPNVTLIDIDGLLRPDGTKDGAPVIVDSAEVFRPPGTEQEPGGFGLAVRPCDVATGNAPTATRDCTWPLVYGSLRNAPVGVDFTVGARDPASCIGELCWPEVASSSLFAVLGAGADPGTHVGMLGDIAFADDRGDRLYMLRTSPGALLQVDTSLDERGVPRNVPVGAPLELCDAPSRMQVYREEALAFVTCFQADLVFAIDLQGFRVVDAIRTGSGAHDMVVDPVRRVLYVANTLESSISIIHLDRERSTFLKELARLGLQEPFSQ